MINNISAAAQQQAQAASGTSDNMNVIQEITVQTSTGTEESVSSIGRLLELTNELRRSVSGFRLP